ncbi:MAG: hypothetical protein JSS49_12220 [Planctomycetes bacterium]|nr:hypothetical protein [Planctomycetota bacterium]
MNRLTRLLAIGVLALVAGTWKLWTPQTVFPQVPLISAACNWPAWCDWVCLSLLALSSVALLLFPLQCRRMASAGVALALAGFFVLDQHRLQPWAWQFFLLALLLSLADDATARRGWNWLAISIYFWSAISKLDYTFCHEQGPALLGGLKQAMGVRGLETQWTRLVDVAGSFGFALGELSVAILLAWPRTRGLGLWIAILMHVTLLAALGPLGLNHSHGVLLWNLFFIAQDWLLFRSIRHQSTLSDDQTSVPWITRIRNRLEWPQAARSRLALALIVGAIIWPSLEPVGLCDHWLAWAVYSARPGQSHIIANSGMNLGGLPITEKISRDSIEMDSTMHHPLVVHIIETGRWSLQALGVPILPEVRFQIGVACHLAEHAHFRGAVILSTPANRWTGASSQQIVSFGNYPEGDVATIAKSFFWNSRQRRWANDPFIGRTAAETSNITVESPGNGLESP